MNALGWACLSEFDLVVEARIGNLAAFDALVRRYRNAAMVQARAILRQRELAEDATQDAFLAAYKALPTLNDPTAFGPWLGTIVRHRATRLLAGEAPASVPLDSVILAHTPSIVAAMELDRQGCLLREAVAALGADIAPVMQLYYFDEWPVAKVALFLALPRTTVKWRLHVGRARLQEILSPNWEELNESGT
ncbi:MAG: RNA polymerase sigma factor [Fimbriimonadaceae bacterium]